jgi:lipoprotein-anchoring transpeptidase ErfK/SrfK
MTTMSHRFITRRRFLAGASAVLATPALAQPFPIQLPPLLPPAPLGEPRNIEPPFQRQRPTEPRQGPPRQAEEVSREDWFTDAVQDGPHQLRKVNLELLDPEFRRQLVTYRTSEQPGTLVVDPQNHFLYSIRERGEAIRYGVGVGREGFGWRGQAAVGRKAEWPDWHPPKEMRLRQPELPEKMLGGPENPLGARALYLFEGNRDTLYRIHGTAEPWTIGTNVSSGCVRLLNEEIADLYLRTPIGTRVVVL